MTAPSMMSKNYKVFLTIWFGQLISTLGSGLTNFGIGVWILQHSTEHGTTRFALSALFSTLPAVIFGPFAGALVDRWDRRKAMIVSATGSGAASFGLAVLVLLGKLSLWEIYSLMALSSAFATFTWPAISAITSRLVENAHLSRANSMLQFNDASTTVLAPALAAAIMSAAGARGLEWLVTLDVVSFIVAIIALLLARTPVLSQDKDVVHPTVIEGAIDGFRFILARPGLLGLLCYFLVINFTMPLAFILFTPLVWDMFHSVKIISVVQSLGSIGMILGTIGMSIWGGPKRRIYGVLGFGAAGSAMMCLIGFPPSVPLYIASIGLMTLLFPVVNASSQAIWMRKTPNSMQGRVFAARRVIASLISPIALAIAGPLADYVFEPAMHPGGQLASSLGRIFGTSDGAGIRVLFVLMGVLSVAAALLWLSWPRVRHVERDLPDADDESQSVYEAPVAQPQSIVTATEELESVFREP
jgi:DHA3 family macrolide efflux protein-like MFS transporter